jgi:hypothetical protein
MSRGQAAVIAALLALLPVAAASAGGAGGVGFGAQYYDRSLSSGDLGMAYITGSGYGVDEDGNRVGGFGMALLSGLGVTEGGVGGLLVGHEWSIGPLIAAISLLGGVGGAAAWGGGYMLLFGEAELELGVRVLPWMQIVAYAGYQAWGNLLPGVPFNAARLNSPVYGVRVAFGSS